MLEKLNKFKNDFFPKCEMIIDFNGIVSTSNEIKNVLIEYCNEEKKNLVILKEGMNFKTTGYIKSFRVGERVK